MALRLVALAASWPVVVGVCSAGGPRLPLVWPVLRVVLLPSLALRVQVLLVPLVLLLRLLPLDLVPLPLRRLAGS